MYCAHLNKLRNINAGSTYIVGDKMTVADLENANTMITYLKNDNSTLRDKHSEVLSKYGSLEEYSKNLESELAEYFSTRPSRPF